MAEKSRSEMVVNQNRVVKVEVGIFSLYFTCTETIAPETWEVWEKVRREKSVKILIHLFICLTDQCCHHLI